MKWSFQDWIVPQIVNSSSDVGDSDTGSAMTTIQRRVIKIHSALPVLVSAVPLQFNIPLPIHTWAIWMRL
jgi:hypothetical protein